MDFFIMLRSYHEAWTMAIPPFCSFFLLLSLVPLKQYKRGLWLLLQPAEDPQMPRAVMAEESRMARVLKALVALLLLVLLLDSPPCQAGTVPNGRKATSCLVTKTYRRNALLVATMDYGYGGPNTIHDPPPKTGKPGIGGKL